MYSQYHRHFEMAGAEALEVRAKKPGVNTVALIEYVVVLCLLGQDELWGDF